MVTGRGAQSTSDTQWCACIGAGSRSWSGSGGSTGTWSPRTTTSRRQSAARTTRARCGRQVAGSGLGHYLPNLPCAMKAGLLWRLLLTSLRGHTSVLPMLWAVCNVALQVLGCIKIGCDGQCCRVPLL